MKCASFNPVARPDARVLILGSLPGAESLRRCQYYAKKANRFWWIMGELAGAGLEMAYEARLACLKKNRIALWDVCASAYRRGSLDSNIRADSVVPNDFCGFLAQHKHIKLICFNGQPAERLFRLRVLPYLPKKAAAIPRHILPSTSPAHAGMPPAEKLARWRKALGPFVKKPAKTRARP